MLQDLEVDDDPLFIQPGRDDRNLNLPVVAMEFFTPSVKVA